MWSPLLPPQSPNIPGVALPPPFCAPPLRHGLPFGSLNSGLCRGQGVCCCRVLRETALVELVIVLCPALLFRLPCSALPPPLSAARIRSISAASLRVVGNSLRLTHPTHSRRTIHRQHQRPRPTDRHHTHVSRRDLQSIAPRQESASNNYLHSCYGRR